MLTVNGIFNSSDAAGVGNYSSNLLANFFSLQDTVRDADKRDIYTFCAPFAKLNGLKTEKTSL